MKTLDKIVVVWFSFLYIIVWAFSLANLFHVHFWDKRYALSTIMMEPPSEEEGIGRGFDKIIKSYYTDLRYVWFLPHVLGAIFWWNLYFLQLIPQLRHNRKAFHRMLGRFLLVLLLIQNTTGFALASTSDSNIVTMVSYILNAATIFCIAQAWKYAHFRDIAQHKYWALRLVGYMHTISLQRLFLALLIITHSMGWSGLYPQLDETASSEEWAKLVKNMFDDSFVLCILIAILSTEWYLSAEEGKMETPMDYRNNKNLLDITTVKRSSSEPHETSSLVASSPYGPTVST